MRILTITLITLVMTACGGLPDPLDKLPKRPFEKIPTFPELHYNETLAAMLATYENELKSRNIETYHKDLIELDLVEGIEIAGYPGEAYIQGSCTRTVDAKTGDIEKHIRITRNQMLNWPSVFHLFGECLHNLKHDDEELSFMNQDFTASPLYYLENRANMFNQLADMIIKGGN